MGQKTNNRILWHGNGLNAEGKAVAPVKAVAGGDGTDGLNEGELYICNSDSDPALFILTDAGNVVRIDGNGSDTYTREQINEKLNAKVDVAFFSRMFGLMDEEGGEIQVNDVETLASSIKAKLGFWTEQYLSAKGKNPDSGSEVSGATTLAALSDVSITGTPKDGQVLAFDATLNKWTPVDMEATAGIDEEELLQILTQKGYATQQWVTQQSYAKTSVRIKAGTGLTGGGTLAQDVTLSLATVGTAGTYTKVTVDSYGRVTGHASLAAGDIPALAISKITGLQAALDAKMDAADFEELFEKVYVSGYGYAIRAKLALYTDSWMSAKGSNPDAGSVVAGASALVDLSDVAISNPQDGQILSWNGTKWVNADAPSAGLDETALAEYLTTNHYAKTTDIPSLEGYATQSWASGQFALKTVAINAGTGLTGGGNLSANRTLSLATVGTAGTYTKVTVDSYGRVTGHASLAAGDIPALAISKITGLQAALDAKMDAADFEELFEKVYVSGYGYAIRAKLALYTDSWMSAKGSNPDAGSVSAGLDEEQLAEYLTTHGYATQNWVNQQGFLKSVSWDDVTGKPTWIGSTKPTYTAAEVGALTQDTADGRYVRQNLGYIGNNADLDDYTGSGLYVVSASSYATIGNFPTESAYGYGTLVSLMFAEGRGVQWYIPDYSHPMAIRQAWLADKWQGWTYLLTHQNYSSYTVTKTGGGASGTWGIGITGNAGSATKLQTARTIALSGAVSGSATFDGSAGVTLSTTFNAQSLLTSLKTVDGSGCGLDADMLDGYEATDFYRKKVANAVSVSKALSDLVAENGSVDAWNSPSNSSLFLTNNNNALSFYVGGTQNERTANIQAGHSNATYYANILGTLYLNRLGGNVCIGNPDTTAHRLNVDGGIYTDSYIQVGSARLRWDSANNALYVQKSDGTQCGFYATGFVSAKGANDDGGDTEATVLTIADERNTAIYPDTYAGRGIRGLFRANATDGLNDGGTYHTVLHIRQWANSSGGLSHQLAFTDNGGVWHRTALSETAWGEWSELSALSGLGDVQISSPSNGQSLVYRNGIWKNETVSGGGASSVAWADVTGKPTWIPDTDGSGSGIDADLLDGTHKSGLFTAMTYLGSTLSLTIGGVRKTVNIETSAVIPTVTVSSTSSRNLSVNVGGSTDYVSNLYATYSTYADFLRTARTIWGQSFNGSGSVSGNLTGVGSISMSGSISRVADITMTGDLTGFGTLLSGYGAGNRRTKITANNFGFLAATTGWGVAFKVYSNDGGDSLGEMAGAYGSGNTLKYTYYGGTYDSPAMVILPSNKYVGIGTTSPSYKLHVSGTAYATGGFQNGSDIRYKHVLQDLALTVAQVAAAPSFLFRWTDSTADGIQAGTSAQYWRQVMPQVVMESAGRLSMQYDKAALAAAIATARAVETLDQRVARLEKENKKLRFRIKMLEKR